MRNPWLWTMLIGVLSPWPTNGAAGEEKIGYPKVNREIYVPFEDLPLLLEEAPGRVLLSRDEYEAMLSAVPEREDAHAPVAATVVSADYVVNVGRGRAEFAGMLIIDVIEPGIHALELEAGHVGVRRATLDGQGAPLARTGPNRLTLFVEGEGRHRLMLDLTAPVETAAARQTLTFQVPTPPATRLSIIVPGNVEIKSGASVVSRTFDDAGQTTRFEILVPRPCDRVLVDESRQVSRVEPTSTSGAVTLEMTLNGRLSRASRAVSARGVLIDEITASYERLYANYSMTVLHQPVDRFRFALPDGFEVTDVESPLLSHWSVKSELSRSFLDIELREPTIGTVAIRVSLLAAAHPASWKLPRLEPLDVVSEAVVVGLLVDERLSLRSLNSDKLIQIDTEVITGVLSNMIASGPGTPRLRAVAAFYAPTGSEGFDASGVFEPTTGRFLVTTNLMLSLDEKELRVQGGFALRPTIERLFAVDMAIPTGWQLLSVTDANGAGLRFEPFANTERNDTSKVRILLPGGVAPGASHHLYFDAAFAPNGWLGDWKSNQVAFPAFSIIGAEGDTGAIIVQTDDEMIAYPEITEGLIPLDDRDKSEFGFTMDARGTLAFRYEGRPFRATFRVERIPTRVTAKSYSFFHLDRDLFSAHYEFVFDVARAKTDTLFFSLPEGTSADLTVQGLDGTAVRDYSSALIDGRRRWSVHLGEPRRGLVRLAINLEEAFDCTKTGEFALPMVRAENVAHQSGVIAVKGSAELDLETVTSLRKVDVGELAGAVSPQRHGTSGGLGVFAYTGDDPVIGVRVGRRSPFALPTAIVQRAEVITQVAANGFAQTAARLLLRTTAAFVEIELPADSDLWSVELDGKPMLPQRENNRLVLGLSGGDRLLDLRIVYGTLIERIGLSGEVALAPIRFFVRAEQEGDGRVEVPNADAQWTVYLPPGFRLANYSGTLATSPMLSPEPAAWSVAKLLWSAGGGIRPFYGFGLPSLSRAREMSVRYSARKSMSFDDVKAAIGGESHGTWRDSSTADEDMPSRRERPGVAKSVPATSQLPDGPALNIQMPIEPAVANQSGDKSQIKLTSPLATAKSEWALEGVRSLKINLDASAQAVVFRSLGGDPRLTLKLNDERRFTSLGWGIALATGLIGLVLTSRPARTKVLYVAGVATVATVIPILLNSSELTRLANPIFYAVSFLAVYYVALRLVRWLVANARQPIRFRAPATATTAMIALAFVSVCHGESPSAKGTPDDPIVVRAAEPVRPIIVPEDAVIVPYDPTTVSGPFDPPRPGKQVLIPYAQYKALWALVHGESMPKTMVAPQPFALAGGAFNVKLPLDGDLEVEGYLDIVLYVDEFISVPLVFSEAILTHAEVDGQPAQLGPTTGGLDARSSDPNRMTLALQLKGIGRHRLDLGVRLPVTRQGGWRLVQGRLPAPPGTALTVQVPHEGTEVHLMEVCDGGVRETTAADESIVTALGTEGTIQIRWRPRTQESLGEASLTSESDLLIDVREDGVQILGRLTLDGGRTERDSHRFILPRDYLIQSINGPNVRDWVLTGADEQEAVVSLLKASKGSEQITFVLHRRQAFTREPSRTLDVPTIRVVGAALQSGRLTVRRSPLLDLAADSTTGLARTDTPPELDRLAALSPESTVSPLGMSVYQSYRFASLPYAMKLIVRPKPSELRAEQQTILRIGDRRRTLETRLQISPLQHSIHRVDIQVPRDVHVDQVEAPGAFEWSVTDGEVKTIALYLSTGQAKPFAVVIRGSTGAEGPIESLELPAFGVIGAPELLGEVAVQIDSAFDLSIESLQNCREIPLDETYAWLVPAQRSLTRTALRISGQPFSTKFRLTPRRPEVTCTTVSNVRVTESTIEETVLLDFDVSQAGIREIEFTLPWWMKDADISVPMLRTKTLEPATAEPESPIHVQLVLQDEIMGRVRVLVENDRMLNAEAFEVPLPMVQTGQINRRFITVESAGRDEVTVQSQAGFESLVHSQSEWQLLSEWIGATPTQAYVAKDDDAALSLKTQERAKVDTAGAGIGLASTVLVVDESGEYRATQSYRIDNRTEAYLEVRLPDGAKLWSVQVAGEPAKPAESSNAASEPRVRIPLTKSAAGDLDYEVVLRYAGTLPRPGAAREVDFPLPRVLNIPVELSQVSLFLPEDFQWFDFDGTMRPARDAAELAALFVRYQTKITERLGQALEGGNPFDRARASANLREIESQIDQVRRITSGQRGNAALAAELQSNEEVLHRAQAQQQQQQQVQMQKRAETGNGQDHRAKLNESFQNQRVSRARNQVQETFDNFRVESEAPVADRPAFDPAWMRDQSASVVGPQPDGKASMGKKGDSIVRRKTAPDQPPVPRFAPQAEGAFQKDRGQDYLVVQGDRRRGSGGTQELAEQYQQQLEKKAGVETRPSASARGVATGRTAGEATTQAGLFVDFPIRGTAFYFTTPRGEAGITARSISKGFLQRVGRLGIIALATAALIALYFLSLRRDMAALLGRRGSTVLLVLGIASIVSGVLLIMGIATALAGLALKIKARETGASSGA